MDDNDQIKEEKLIIKKSKKKKKQAAPEPIEVFNPVKFLANVLKAIEEKGQVPERQPTVGENELVKENA